MDSSSIRTVTINRLADWRYQSNSSLPLLEEIEELIPPTEATVARRAAAASCLAAVAYGWNLKAARTYLDDNNLWPDLTAREQHWLKKRAVSKQERTQFSWIVESMQFFAWALNLFPEPNHLLPCDDSLASLFPPRVALEQFLKSARLTPLTEIRQECDTLYMLHWSLVQASLSTQIQDIQAIPTVRQRRHAAEWIIGAEANWEDVSLDT